LLPLAGAGAPEDMRVVPAKEILDKIERGEPVEYDHVIIKGDLDLRGIDLPKRRVNRTSFEIKILDLSENASVVSSRIVINHSTIEDNVYFNDSIFNYAVEFSDSKFNGTADFDCSEFNGAADFSVSEFNGDACFGISKFNGTADFRDSKFNGTAYFEDSKFNGTADFSDSEFNDYADFVGSAFNIFDFSSVQFNKQAIFNDARFNDCASFNSSIFKDDALFEGASFDGPLFLTRAKYYLLYVRWKNIKELGYDDAAFLALLENFKKLGYLEDYDACYYEYRRLHRDQDWGGGYHSMPIWEEGARKWIDLGLQCTYGYGKKPILPLLWSAGTVLLFALIWRAFGLRNGNHRGLWEKYGLQGARQTSGQRGWPGELRALGEALLFSATVFLSGTRLFVDPPAMPVFEGWLASHVRAFFIAERVLGALFSILFFLAIGGTVVR